jgi:hypothetical protein
MNLLPALLLLLLPGPADKPSCCCCELSRYASDGVFGVLLLLLLLLLLLVMPLPADHGNSSPTNFSASVADLRQRQQQRGWQT